MGICQSFQKKKKKNKKYSYLNKFKEEGNERITDLYELNDKQYCLFFMFSKLIKFLDWNKKIITGTIKFENDFWSSYSKNQLFLMNKNDLFVAGNENIMIIDIQKK